VKFKEFNTLMQKHIQSMMKDQEYLFIVDLDKETVWNTYLDSFPEGTNEIFRERRDHDCSCCRHYVRDLGRVVTIKNNKVTTIWDFDAKSDTYQPVVDALSKLVKSAAVINVNIPTSKKIGTEKSREGTHIWHHFHTKLPACVKIFRRDQFGTVQGRMRDIRNVLKRSLEEINPDAVATVLELIAQKSLYKGEEWKTVLGQFQKLQKKYKKTAKKNQENFCWEASVKVGAVVGKIRNHSIGVLLTDISEGMDLDNALRRYEAIVAPANYKRPKAIFTKKMVQQAQKTVKELGFEESLGRRYAQLDDITVPNTLFANRNVVKVVEGDVFEELAASVPQNIKNLSKVEEITIDKFIEDVLPNVSEVEALLENSHASNMVSLIAPMNKDSKSMLKWNNNFSWAYSGNITDSMKERVKAAGGKVDGVLRFSIQWNDNKDNNDDLDAHCIEPNGNEIYFSDMRSRFTDGNLDVDITNPNGQTKDGVAVENITWPSKTRILKGNYKFFVHNYAKHGGRSGFTAEIEFDGKIHSFEYAKPLRRGENVQVADVSFDGDKFTIQEKLKSTESSKKIWELDSNNFHPVSIAMSSPNYWDDQQGIGHKHYFFMLQGCKNPETPNGFFNEFLQEDLMKHKRVFEALGSKMKVQDSDNQLSGLGFSSTKRAHVILKVKGNFERLLKVKF